MVWAVGPWVVVVAARLRLRSGLRPSLRLRQAATRSGHRSQGDISISVNRVTFLLLDDTLQKCPSVAFGYPWRHRTLGWAYGHKQATNSHRGGQRATETNCLWGADLPARAPNTCARIRVYPRSSPKIPVHR